MPDIQFVNSPRTENERLKMTRRVIGQGFYEKHGFVVLPELKTELDPNIQVIYPREFEYRKLSVSKLTGEWQDRESSFWQQLAEYLPGKIEYMSRVEVRLTRYGTISSGDWMKGEPGKQRIYYLREDAEVGDLAAMMVNDLLHLEKVELGITWSKREALMDFIMTRPAMKKLFPKFRPVMSQLARVSAEVRKNSEKYLRELGIPRTKEEFEIAKMPLSKLEKKVMKQLVEHQGELVSYDQLADSVWGVGEFKTFWAINKLVERMRVKLAKLGIEGARIQAVRGQGYLLT